MKKTICNDGFEILEENFEVENFELIWNSEFSEFSGGGYNRIYYNIEEELYLLYTNKHGFEGTWSCLIDCVEFFTEDAFFDEVYTSVIDAQNGWY